MALANRLVGNAAFMPALETTLTGAVMEFCAETVFAVTGAAATCALNDENVKQHATIVAKPDDVLVVGPAVKGVRSYVAFAGGLAVDKVLGSESTYTVAGLGGHDGRALRKADELVIRGGVADTAVLETPAEYRPPMLDAWSIRAGRSCETVSIDDPGRLFETKFTVANRSDRMGIKLDGETYVTDYGGKMPSAPVFPGIIQCPTDGSLFILSVDAGTTGGYPRVAKIVRMDLHILGQLRPGNSLTLIKRDDEDAAHELREKHAYWRPWLSDIAEVI